MAPKRILAMQDLSCVGRCSLTVVLPVLSAYGIEACALPTALLSNHTAFAAWSCLDLAPEIEKIMAAWRANDFQFDGFLLGYLGSPAAIDAAKTCFRDFSRAGAKVIIDPVLGDHGKLYAALDPKYVTAMRHLIASADILLPNLTEACFLTGTEYRAEETADFARETVKRLAELTPAAIVLTGVEHGGEIGELIYADGAFSQVWAQRLPHRCHGTGDLFAAVFAAIYFQTGDMEAACAAATDFVTSSLLATDGPCACGVNFEYALSRHGTS